VAAEQPIDPPSQPAPIIESSHSTVRLVVGSDNQLTFEGEKTTWDDLPRLFEKIPNRKTVILEITISTDEISVRTMNDAISRASALAHAHGFRDASYTGVTATAAQSIPKDSKNPTTVPGYETRPTDPVETAPSPSLKVRKKIVDRDKLLYERMKRAVAEGAPASELERTQSDYEISVALLEQAMRSVEYRKLLVQLAEAEYAQVIEANKAGARVPQSEVYKLELKVKLAKAKLAELAD
jgi:hypothetical protein